MYYYIYFIIYIKYIKYIKLHRNTGFFRLFDVYQHIKLINRFNKLHRKKPGCCSHFTPTSHTRSRLPSNIKQDEAEQQDVVGAEAVGFSHGHFGLVVQAFDDAERERARRAAKKLSV
jgi:hypothetical protein